MKHPNLLDYISAWYEDNKNRVVIITELLQGGNLREHRKYQKNLKINLIKKWIKQLLSALDFLHSNDYIHHDIKCQNILVDRISGNLKLGDLIFAEKLGNREYFTKYVGTEEFMAPEVKDGKYTLGRQDYDHLFGINDVMTLTPNEKSIASLANATYLFGILGVNINSFTAVASGYLASFSGESYEATFIINEYEDYIKNELIKLCSKKIEEDFPLLDETYNLCGGN